MAWLVIGLISVAAVSIMETECSIQCRTGINCKLPNCYCKSRKAPGGLTKSQIPQMVVFTFDDAVRKPELDYYNRLFAADRLNPNGCPVKMTLFLQDKDTDYEIVRSLHRRGMEIASHSITHRIPQFFWREISDKLIREEIYGQKLNIHRNAGVPLSDIRGWRSPFLQPSGNLQFDVLTDSRYGFTYDATLGVEKRDLTVDNMWPFTLDFGYDILCSIPPCPTNLYPGLWEIPVTSMIDNENYPRVYVDAYRPVNVTESSKFLIRNFESYYKTNRAPLILNMHAAWFFYDHNLEAMDLFIRRLLSYEDVYFVTVQELIEWMRAPSALDKIHQFKPWGCTFPKLPTTLAPVPVYTRTITSSDQGQRLGSTPVDRLCVQGHSCLSPKCRCSAGINPDNMDTKALPQIVMFTFDGAVHSHHLPLYTRLFPRWRKNPNGSPISMTLFLSHKSTDYDTVRDLYSRGMEVAVNSITRRLPTYFWRDATTLELESEILGQRSNINRLAGIPIQNINGWRSPFFQPTGDKQFKVLYDSGFEYDSSLILNMASRTQWPFTLDFGWSKECSILPCPQGNYPGLWMVPVIQSVNSETGLLCSYVHNCSPTNRSTALEFIGKNFNSYYQGNKAPFMVSIKSLWLIKNKEYVDTIEKFIEGLQKLNDVYIVTIQQGLEWMKRPTSLESIDSFTPWQSRMADVEGENDNNPGIDELSIPETPEVKTDSTSDWVIAVLVIVAVIFSVCLVILIGATITRKRHNRKRTSSLKEAITATSEGNSVTDWLNTFPRRFSQFSCSNGNSGTDGHHNRGFDSPDNVTVRSDNDELAPTSSTCKNIIKEQDGLDVDPVLLEANYSRDMAIWNQQEIKIPHMLHKSQKKKDKGSKSRLADTLPKEIQSKRYLNSNQTPKSQKHFKYVWHPTKNQNHSESVFGPKFELRHIEPCHMPHVQGIYSKLQQKKQRRRSRPSSVEEQETIERRPRCGRNVTRSGFYSLGRESSLAYSESDPDSEGQPVLLSSRSYHVGGPPREDRWCRSYPGTASRSDYGSENSSGANRHADRSDPLDYAIGYKSNLTTRQYRARRKSDHNKRYSKSDHGSVRSWGQTGSTKSDRSRSQSVGRCEHEGKRRSRHRNRSLDNGLFQRDTSFGCSKRDSSEILDENTPRQPRRRDWKCHRIDRNGQIERNSRCSHDQSEIEDERHLNANYVDEKRITAKMKVQWEKEIMEQLGEFLKSKAGLRELRKCRDSETVEDMEIDSSDTAEKNYSV